MNDRVECQACSCALANPGRGGVYLLSCLECRARLLANSPEAFEAVRGSPERLQASIADIVRQDRNGGPAIAAVQMSSDLGSIIGPIIAGVLVDEGSYGLAFAVTGLIGLLAVIPWLRARETANVA